MGHDRFLSNPYPIIIHKSSHHSTPNILSHWHRRKINHKTWYDDSELKKMGGSGRGLLWGTMAATGCRYRTKRQNIQNSRSPGPDRNPKPPEYEAVDWLTDLWCVETMLYQLNRFYVQHQILGWLLMKWKLCGGKRSWIISHSVETRTNTRWPVMWWFTRQWVVWRYLATPFPL
jgi:hypothetical protein